MKSLVEQVEDLYQHYLALETGDYTEEINLVKDFFAIIHSLPDLRCCGNCEYIDYYSDDCESYYKCTLGDMPIVHECTYGWSPYPEEKLSLRCDRWAYHKDEPWPLPIPKEGDK